MKNTFITVALLMLAIISCKKKDDTVSIPPTTIYSTYSSIDTIFTMLSLQPKVVSLLSDSGGSFYGNSGTRYIFKKSCFVDASGATVTGNVQISVTEYLKKGDMIFSGVLPVSDGEPLISGGEINVTATKGGQEIFIKPGMTYSVNIPQSGSKDTVMSYFRGNTTGGSIANKVNWKIPDSGKNREVYYTKDSLGILPDSLNYTNADRFLTNPDYQSFNVTVNASGTTINSNTLYTYALYDNYKGLWPLQNASTNVYSEHHVPNIPVHFVSFCLINGHFYGGVLGATPKTGSNYSISLTEVKPDDFKAQINGLY